MKDKSYYARLFVVPEKDIVPEFIPMFMAFEEIIERNNKLADLTANNMKIIDKNITDTNSKINELASRIINSRESDVHHHHNYSNMTTTKAFLTRWGNWCYISTLIFIGLILLYYFGMPSWYMKKNLANDAIIYDSNSNSYYINYNDYEPYKKGSFKGIKLKSK